MDPSHHHIDRDPSLRLDDHLLDDLDLDQAAGAMTDTDLSPRTVTDMNANMILSVHRALPVMDMVSAKDRDRDRTVEVEADDQDLHRDGLVPSPLLDAAAHEDTVVRDQEAIADRWKKWNLRTRKW